MKPTKGNNSFSVSGFLRIKQNIIIYPPPVVVSINRQSSSAAWTDCALYIRVSCFIKVSLSHQPPTTHG